MDKLPEPAIGDIVMYPGKWKDGQPIVGRLSFLQYVESRNQWIADVVEFKGIGNGLYRDERGRRKSDYVDVAVLQPLMASYVRSSDAWKVPLKNGQPEPLAPRYFIDENFSLPTPEVDEDKVAQYLEEYEALKFRLLKEAVMFGTAGALVATLTQGVEDGIIFALGAVTGIGYLRLLGRRADQLGSRDVLSNVRFLLPVFLVLGLALRHIVLDGEPLKPFELVPKDQIVCAMLGFVSYRVPLLFSEIKGAFSDGQLLEVLPGSLAKGAQLVSQMSSSDSEANSALAASASVLLISGPAAAGRGSLVQWMLGSDQRNFVKIVPRTTTRLVSSDEDVIVLDRLAFESQAQQGAFLAWSEDPEDPSELSGYRLQDLKAIAAEGKVCVLDLDVQTADKVTLALEDFPDVEITGAWVSLEKVEDFQERLKAKGLPEDRIKGELKTVLGDIEWGIMSGLFDFTLINDDEEKSRRDLATALSYAKRYIVAPADTTSNVKGGEKEEQGNKGG